MPLVAPPLQSSGYASYFDTRCFLRANHRTSLQAIGRQSSLRTRSSAARCPSLVQVGSSTALCQRVHILRRSATVQCNITADEYRVIDSLHESIPFITTTPPGSWNLWRWRSDVLPTVSECDRRTDGRTDAQIFNHTCRTCMRCIVQI